MLFFLAWVSFLLHMVSPEQAELELLAEFVSEIKSFQQLDRDARRFGIDSLIHTNPRRGIAARLETLTGISKDSLTFVPIRCEAEAATSDDRMNHPFVLISTIVEKCLARDEHFFEVVETPTAADVVASSFVNSPEYQTHPLVLACKGSGITVVPISLYSDGIKVCCDTHPDSLYAIYINFIHRGVNECARKESKHVLTVYRKSEATPETLQDIWAVILWDLQALAKGCKPVSGEVWKPLHQQACGPPLNGAWGLWHRVCLMQVRGDWSYYCEA